MELLNPVAGKEYSNDLRGTLAELAKVSGKRIGGGRVQMTVVTAEQLAEILVPVSGGFDKLAGKDWNGKLNALERQFREAGWPMFERAVLIALIDKYVVDPADGFIPLACGTDDIEAGLASPCTHQELAIYGQPCDPDQEFLEAIHTPGMFGFAEEFHNLGPSIELVMPVYTPGMWQEIKDTQIRRDGSPMNRVTVLLAVTPYAEYSCPGNTISVNSMNLVPPGSLSVKALKAVDLARQFLRMIA